MADDPTNMIFDYLRRIDAKLDRVIEEVGDLKVRVTSLEERFAQVELSIAGVNCRIDRIESATGPYRDSASRISSRTAALEQAA